jgi:hypothetical protein
LAKLLPSQSFPAPTPDAYALQGAVHSSQSPVLSGGQQEPQMKPRMQPGSIAWKGLHTL